ncbi:unnamed protein product, partial [Urochloa humidicola]
FLVCFTCADELKFVSIVSVSLSFVGVISFLKPLGEKKLFMVILSCKYILWFYHGGAK